MMAVAQGLHRGLNDKIGRAEIGLADAEVDDVAALRRQGVGPGKHSEGVFLADAIESRDGTKHDCSPPARAPFADIPRRLLNEDCTSADQAAKIKRRQDLRR